MTETSEILRKAKALIDTPEKWTIFAEARDKYGERVYARESFACKFCAEGAIYAAGGYLGDDRDEAILFRKVIGQTSIFGWNDEDGRTHAEVMEAFDKAIALAEAESAPAKEKEGAHSNHPGKDKYHG